MVQTKTLKPKDLENLKIDTTKMIEDLLKKDDSLILDESDKNTRTNRFSLRPRRKFLYPSSEYSNIEQERPIKPIRIRDRIKNRRKIKKLYDESDDFRQIFGRSGFIEYRYLTQLKKSLGRNWYS